MRPETYGGNLGDMLLRDGLVTNDALEEALRRQQETNQPLGRILVEMNAISESVKLNFFHKRFGHDIVSLRDHQIPEILFGYVSPAMALKYRVIPHKLEGDTLVVAMEDPSNLVTLDNLKAQIGLKIRPVIASFADIEALLESFPKSDEDEEEIVEVPAGFGRRLFKYLFFPILAFAPLATIIALLIFSDEFQKRMLLHPPFGFDTMDMILSIVLIWGLWSLLIYELDGLIVNPEKR